MLSNRIPDPSVNTSDPSPPKLPVPSRVPPTHSKTVGKPVVLRTIGSAKESDLAAATQGSARGLYAAAILSLSTTQYGPRVFALGYMVTKGHFWFK